jgi:hypothetical protein
MKFNLWTALAAIAITLSMRGSAARAAVTLYTDPAAFAAAVAGLSSATETFDAAGLQAFTHVTSTDGSIGPAGWVLGGFLSGSVWKDAVSRSLGESTTFSFDSTNLIGAGAFFDTSTGGEGQGLSITEFLAPSPTFPFGGQLDVNTSLGGIHGTFFGWTSSDPFTSFTIRAGPFAGGLEGFDMDNLTFAAVPEPSGIGLAMISGLAATLAWRAGRRRP